MPFNNSKQNGRGGRRIGRSGKNKRSSRRSVNKTSKNKKNICIIIKAKKPKKKTTKPACAPAVGRKEGESSTFEQFLDRYDEKFFKPFDDDALSDISHHSDDGSFYSSDPESVLLGGDSRVE